MNPSEITNKRLESVEDVYLCPECFKECEQGENDADKFLRCPVCKKTDFTGEIKPIQFTKYTYTLTEYIRNEST